MPCSNKICNEALASEPMRCYTSSSTLHQFTIGCQASRPVSNFVWGIGTSVKALLAPDFHLAKLLSIFNRISIANSERNAKPNTECGQGSCLMGFLILTAKPRRRYRSVVAQALGACNTTQASAIISIRSAGLIVDATLILTLYGLHLALFQELGLAYTYFLLS
ncbi:hypothetical protein F5B22DRAFT_602722 [Xylaria bambusicola]|uniref:uncharacterized protein n=1 Tax=Xylaria bambusicola TaxID=326684 RepID=UPI0020088D84|nr:uncharacterized protein F5B22DRAFT_602722 [Xylaria bambusicola]KAI0517853.1 hypothetical protein F5B22DRAFT_602722 [Xylaria bambusicola]